MSRCEKREVSKTFLQRRPADGDTRSVRGAIRHQQQLQATEAFPRPQTGDTNS